ncbi:MAG TPA: sulfite exporter TauE/SafE family protein [Candidatus Acidoferrum sp.]|nr:sulfite exporter TauE/SafE family protein [Candidatus Acidoferrum sp.]
MSLSTLILIPVVCFFGGFFSTLAGLGGGLLTLAATSLILPVSVVIPLNGVLILAGQVTRVLQFWRHINWAITIPFIPGSMLGASIGTFIYFGLPEYLIAFILGCVLMWFCWVPPTDRARKLASYIPFPFFWVGFAHTFLSTISGAGVLFQSVMVNSKLPKEGLVATIAGTLLFMALFKSIGYLVAGFDYTPYLVVIGLSWIMGIIGTMLARKFLDQLPDSHFRLIIKAIITLFALRLFWTVGAHFAASA